MNLRKINKVSLIASGIDIGDVIPVGGNSLTNEQTKFLKVDKIPDELQEAFDSINKIVSNNIENPQLLAFLKQYKISMSTLLFAKLLGFTTIIAKRFPNIACRDGSREAFYSDNPTANLSDLFEKHLFKCAEFAAIAQLYLQSMGVDSEYVGGEYVGDKNWEFGDQHSFVIIHENDIDYVFDPANNNANAMPNISVVELTQEQKVMIQSKLLTGKRKVAFFETRDIITNRKSFYGYGDGANILEDMFFEKKQPVQNIPVLDTSRD